MTSVGMLLDQPICRRRDDTADAHQVVGDAISVRAPRVSFRLIAGSFESLRMACKKYCRRLTGRQPPALSMPSVISIKAKMPLRRLFFID